jgi:hypothetical protein
MAEDAHQANVVLSDSLSSRPRLTIGKKGQHMTTIIAIIRNGQLELPKPLDLPDGTEVEVLVPELEGTDFASEEQPMTPEEIARTLAAMDQVEPLEMTAEERATLDAHRQAQKEWEKAHFDERADKLGRMWE